MKNKITTVLDSDIKWELTGGTLSAAIEYLQTCIDAHGSDALLDLECDDDDTNLRIIEVREETDEEAKARENAAMQAVLAAQKRQEQADLRAFEALRVKLGK